MRIERLFKQNMVEWCRVRNELWPVEDVSEHENELLSLLEHDEFLAWGAWVNGKLVGFLEFYIRPFANGCETRPVPYLEGIWVDADQRTSRVASKLLDRAETWAKSQGFTEMGSDALLENTISQQVHARWGFQEVERVVCFRKELK